MKKTIGVLLLLAISFGALWICEAARADNRRVEAMALRWPGVQEVCDRAGGCANVSVECTRYDGYGNSDLRDTTVWMVAVGRDKGYAFFRNDESSAEGPALAARDLIWKWKSGATDSELTPAIVWPHYKPCDEECGK